MSILVPAPEYTDKDFDSLRLRLIALVKSVFPDWSDFDTVSFGTVLIELYAFVGDVLTFYQDNLARESRLVTATQRKNVMALARMLGYRMHGARAATTELELRLAKPPGADVLIPALTTVRTQEITEPVRFQLQQEARIVAGSDPPVAHVIAEHSETDTQRFDARGQANLEIPLGHTPYLDGSATVSTPTGPYTEVESFLGSRPNDRHVMVLVDQNERATLRFGDGRSGLPPSGTITVRYKTGGGPDGNLDANRLVVIEGAFRDAHGWPVQVSVTNPQPASGGVGRQSIASAKLLAPESLRAMTRSVAREDFEINARRLPEVARALMLTSNEDPGIDENSGVLHVVPRGGGVPSPALKERVLEQVTEVYPCTLTFQVSVADPVYRALNITARVFLRQGERGSLVATRIRKALAVFFAISEPDGTPNPRVDFGLGAGEVAWSDVFNVVRDTAGVRKLGDGPSGLTINGASADVKLAIREFPVLGQIDIVDGETGSSL